MKVRITPPEGKKLKHIKTEAIYSEVVCEEKEANYYVLADGEGDPALTRMIDGTTLSDRVDDLEDAVIELAEIITEGGE